MVAISSKFTDIADHLLFSTLISCVSDGVLITDETGEVLCLNSAFKEHLGEKKDGNEDSVSFNNPILERIIDIISRQSSKAITYASKSKSSLEKFVRLNEQVFTDAALDDTKFYCRSIDIPDYPYRLRVVISQNGSKNKVSQAFKVLKNNDFITNAPEMMSIISRLEQIADSTAPVMLMGETGTGKTQIARMIHELSSRSNKPLVEVNCAAIPDQLLESELFGHVKGAFTGATQQRLGRFQAANGGVLLLDEIGEIPLHLQAKLLRAIQDQKFEPVGSDKTVEVDVRVISATNQNLRDMVNAGEFRADLFYRIAVVPIKIPPLRERVGDIPLLLQHFCKDLTARGYPNDVECTPEAMRLMMDYPWPGNVREMINAVEHAYICSVDKSVVPDSLPQDIRHHRKESLPLGLVSGPSVQANELPSPSTIDETSSLMQDISTALNEAGGNKTLAAKLIGIDRSTLWRRMRKVGLA